MRIPSNRTLAKIAVYGGFASITAVMWMRYKIEDRIRNADFFRLAMTTLRQNKGAVNLLGEPIKETGFDLNDTTKNFCVDDKAQFEIRIRGPKDKGTMYFWATRSLDEGWLLNRLELELKSQPDKRFLLKKPDVSEAQEEEIEKILNY